MRQGFSNLGLSHEGLKNQLDPRTLDAAFAEVEHFRVVLGGAGALVKVLVGHVLRAEAERVGEVRPEGLLQTSFW